jgi:hypothetical protein
VWADQPRQAHHLGRRFDDTVNEMLAPLEVELLLLDVLVLQEPLCFHRVHNMDKKKGNSDELSNLGQ